MPWSSRDTFRTALVSRLGVSALAARSRRPWESEPPVSKTTYSRGYIGFYFVAKSSNLSGPVSPPSPRLSTLWPRPFMMVLTLRISLSLSLLFSLFFLCLFLFFRFPVYPALLSLRGKKFRELQRLLVS